MKNYHFGNPIYFEGKYKKDKIYDLYIQVISCSFEIKKNKIPTIQVKKDKRFFGNEYLESSDGEVVTLFLTSVDLKLFFDHYDVDDLKFKYGWKFKSINGLFTDYVDKWTERKINAKKEKNYGIYTISKLMLNSLYGKFALNPKVQGKFPWLSDDGIVKYSLNKEETRNSVYIPVATFITAYARNKTIRTSQAIKDYSIEKYGKDMYIYSDTDSISTTLPIEECKKFCDIDDYKLYWWKHENNFKKARFVRQKTYVKFIEDKPKNIKVNLEKKLKFNMIKCNIKAIENFYIKDNKLIKTNFSITCSGMPKRCYKNVTFENFKVGFTCDNKLKFTHVKGGVILKNTEFTIKDEKLKKNVKNILK